MGSSIFFSIMAGAVTKSAGRQIGTTPDSERFRTPPDKHIPLQTIYLVTCNITLAQLCSRHTTPSPPPPSRVPPLFSFGRVCIFKGETVSSPRWLPCKSSSIRFDSFRSKPNIVNRYTLSYRRKHAADISGLAHTDVQFPTVVSVLSTCVAVTVLSFTVSRCCVFRGQKGRENPTMFPHINMVKAGTRNFFVIRR